MRVALVHEMLVKMGGAERVLDVLQQLFPNAPIFTLFYDERECGKTFPKGKIVSSGLQKWIRWKVPRQFLITRMAPAIESFDFSGFDLVISSSSAFAHGILTPLSTRHICYCHAPMRYAWDYTHEYLREKSEGIFEVFKRPLLRNIMHRLRIWDGVAAARADLILANSRTTADRIRKFWRREAEVLFPPVDVSRFEAGMTHQDYFLIISALTGFKRIDLAIETFNRLPKHRLVIIGRGDESRHLKSMAGPNIEFLGRKNDANIVEFLKNCRALIFPGLEDFGIVPVEAMAAGKPVIAYGEGGVTETVLPGETGIFFPEPTIKSLEDTLAKFFELEQKGVFDPKKCRKQAEKFSRGMFEEGMRNAVEHIMDEGETL